MWSIGTVTALMLTGNLAFETRASDNSNSPSAYDLSMIDQAINGWEHVPRRARNFVRSLLVLQEDKRLSAKKALQHHWFTNPTCAATFETIYAQSISGWKPRELSSEDIVVEVDTSDLIGTPRSGLQEALSTPIQSQFFTKQMQKQSGDGNITACAPKPDDCLTKPNNTLQASPSRQASSSFPWPSSHNHIHHITNASHQKASQQSSTHSLNASLPSYVPPRSSNPKQDRDTLDPAYGARAAEPSMELSWPSSPPDRKKRLPSSEFTWPSQKKSRRSRV